MNRSVLLLAGGVLLASPWCSAVTAADAKRPNILVIVADDLGYRDLGIQGGKDIPTPAIDRLANAGVRLTSGYVSGPYCSPTRAGLLTGRYQQRFGHEFNPGPPAGANVEVGLPLTETTLAQQLKDGGYRTGMVGKWHLGHSEKFHPLSRGFEEYFGFLGGAHSYLPGKGEVKGPNAILRDHEVVDEKEYLTDAFAREAVAYIDRHKNEPFFLYLTFNAVHGPLEATEEYVKPFADKISDPKRRTYAGMLAAMDKAIDRVLKKLKEDAIDENTLIFFVSDNGGPPVNASSNGELRGYKASTWEGGVRVPFFVTWRKQLPSGKTFDQPAIQLDIAPTALAAAGIEPKGKKFDGVNLLPYLKGEKSGAPHEKLYWRFGPQTAIRAGDWKLVQGAGVDKPILVNLAEDIRESKDLSAENPEKRKELETAWNAWDGELEEPRWKANRKPGAGGGKKKKKKAAA